MFRHFQSSWKWPYYITLPEKSNYKDVNSDTKFCPITLEKVNDYLEAFDKKFDIALTKKIYEEKFLLSFRLGSDDSKLYVNSCCQAEMKKSVSYKIDIVLKRNGDILESQCECAAGMGPNVHCKHVCTVLFACIIFATKKTNSTRRGNMHTKNTLAVP